jgi:RimJ/RimL family protein N-acetyltransferase
LPVKKIYNKHTVNKILGKKTILRLLEKRDLKKSLAWLKDPSVNMYLSQNFREYDEIKEQKWFEFIKSSNNDIVFAIEDIKKNLHIGNCALHKINWEKGCCEMGIMIGDKDYWDKGYGSDAIKSIIKLSLSVLRLKNIVLNVYSYNKRAIKVYKKLGFKVIQIQNKEHFYDGKFWDTLVMELREG